SGGIGGIFTRGGLGVLGSTTLEAQLTVLGSTTLQNFTGINATTTNATTTAFAITGATSTLLKTNANGSVVAAIAGTDYANFAYPFINNATTSLLTFSGGLISASSTSFNLFSTNATSTNATTTNLAISSVASSLLKTLSNGAVVAAVAGTDYVTPAGLSSSVGGAFPFTPTTYGNATSTTIGFFGDFHVDATATCANQYHTFVGDVGTVGGDECAALNVTQQDINHNVIYRFGEANGTWAGEFFANASLVGLNTKTDVPLLFLINGDEKARVDGSSGNFGIGTTSPSQKLSVSGGALISGALTASNIISTGSTTVAGAFNSVSSNLLASTTLLGNSLLGNATTTNLAISNISGAILKTLAGGAVVAAQAGVDYATPGTLAAAFPFTPTTYGNATSTTIGFLGGLLSVGSTTINGNTRITGTATIGTLNGLLYGTNGVVGAVATNTLGLLASSSISATGPLSYNVNTGVFSISQSGASTDGYLSSVDWNNFNSRLSTSTLGLFDKGYFFSTTSASAFLNTYDKGFFFSTTSSNVAVNAFIAASTTIPKTYTANTFTGAQTFNSGITTNSLSIGSLNGLLNATNGAVGTVATNTLGLLASSSI